MRIFTSYFARLTDIAKVKPSLHPISIARHPPTWYNGVGYNSLAPNIRLVYEIKRMTSEGVPIEDAIRQYTEEYTSQVLNNLDPKKVYTLLQNMYYGEDVALLCFESPEKFCHRHLVAQWLTNAGYPVEEFKFT
jgi:hypothetical protein